MKIFHGETKDGISIVSVIDGDTISPLSKYLQHCQHSPSGFSWGYAGSGPSQLAFAILFETTEDLEFTRANYHRFKEKYIATLHDSEGSPVNYWYISSQIVNRFKDGSV